MREKLDGRCSFYKAGRLHLRAVDRLILVSAVPTPIVAVFQLRATRCNCVSHKLPSVPHVRGVDIFVLVASRNVSNGTTIVGVVSVVVGNITGI